MIIQKRFFGAALYKILKQYEIKKALPTFYLGLKSKGHNTIEDVAYSPEEVREIGVAMAKRFGVESQEIGFGEFSEETAKSLLDSMEGQLTSKDIQLGKYYRSEYRTAEGEITEPFDDWVNRVKQRPPNDIYEKLTWYKEYTGVKDSIDN
jgi:hypothetical protein